MTSVLAIIAGLATLGFAAALSAAEGDTDPAMVWEGRVALGFTALVTAVPAWVAQLVLTILAEPGWLWWWWIGAPLAGLSLGPLRAR